MMTEASSKTTRSYAFKTDNLCMIAGIAGEKKLCEDVFRMDEDLEVKSDKENFSEEEEFDWLQQKESMDELLNERIQTFKVVIEMEDQDLILMKNKGILSQRGNLMNLIDVIDEEQI